MQQDSAETLCRGHPANQAPSIKGYLQQQWRVHARIAACDCDMCAEHFPHCFPAVASDLARCAVAVDNATRLVVLELPGQYPAASWPLPVWPTKPLAWLWDVDSQHLAVPCGHGWIHDAGWAEVDLFDAVTRSSAVVQLGYHERDQLHLGPWSPQQGLLAIRHIRGGELAIVLYDAEGRSMYWIICPRGDSSSLQRIAEPAGWWFDGGHGAFAASGDRMLLVGRPAAERAGRPDRFCIWYPQRSEVHDAVLPGAFSRAIMQHWSPDGSLIMCFMESGQVVFYDCCGALVASQEITGGPRSSAWAASGTVAVLYTSTLLLCSVSDPPALVLLRAVQAPCYLLGMPLFAPIARMWLACSTTPP